VVQAMDMDTIELAIGIVVGAVILVSLLVAFVLVRAARDVRLGRNVEKARRLMKEPVVGTLTVTHITPPSPKAAWSRAEITGVLSADGEEPRPIQRAAKMRTALWPRSGQALPVVFDRTRPDFFVIEWAKTEDPSQAAWKKAQRLAAEMKGAR
jgi:uncharacterized protein (DUF58 family)